MAPLQPKAAPHLPSPYDAVLELRLFRRASLLDPRVYSAQVLQAASSTSKRLLIHLSRTPLWEDLFEEKHRPAAFHSVQTLLASIYVLAGSRLPEDIAGVDVVIEVLRGSDDVLQQAKQDVHPDRVAQFSDDSTEVDDATHDRPGSSTGNSHANGRSTTEQHDSEPTRQHHDPTTPSATATANSSERASAVSLDTVALGGTFDHLHPGHQILLTMACWLAKKRTIVGVTDDVLLMNKAYRELLEDLPTRTSKVRSFLNLVNPNLQHDTPALQDVYGPTATDPDVQGLLVSEETRKGADAIAEKRAKDGLSTLELFVIHVISPEQVLDTSKLGKDELLKAKMGSTEIRRRLKEKMDRQRRQS